MFELVATVVMFSLAVLSLRMLQVRKRAYARTHIQCACCRDYCSKQCVSFDIARVNGIPVPICDSCVTPWLRSSEAA